MSKAKDTGSRAVEHLGKSLKDQGIIQVLTHESPWVARYSHILVLWLNGRPQGFKFTGEDLRTVATLNDLPAPHHVNAWGGAASGLLRAWLKGRVIRTTGAHILGRSAKNHAHAYRQYEKCVPRNTIRHDAYLQLPLL